MTDGLAVTDDCEVPLKSGKGLATSNGSTPGLAGRISADLNTLRNVTSESVDSSCITASVLGHLVLGTTPKALAASRSLKIQTKPDHGSGGGLVAGPDDETELVPDPVA